MEHLGIICPRMPGHLNPMTALAEALRERGHRVTFFLVGDAPAVVTEAGFEVVSLCGSVFTAEEYRQAIQKLGTLDSRPALKHTIEIGARSADAILSAAPAVLAAAKVTALVVDQVSSSGGTVAEQLGIPFVTVGNALLLNPDPLAPPFFTHWQPRDVWWARLRNQLYWAGFERLFTPIRTRIQAHRRKLGLSGPRQLSEVWSQRLQVSQQPETFEFPRRALPKSVRFVGPFHRRTGIPQVAFPWERLDGRPLIYASLGTMQNRVAATFQMIAVAASKLDAQLVLSTGNGIAPAALGDLPGQPIVVSYASQMELLRRATLVVTHAGLNTVLETLSLGVPMVALPVTNDQPGVAARVVWAGAGVAIPPTQATPDQLRTLMERVLRVPSYRSAAERLRTSIQSSGGAPRAAELIEQSITG